MPQIDYYAVLEVSEQATTEEIKRAYRRLVRLYHPDVNRAAEENRIKVLNEAYGVLSDTTRRSLYDIRRMEERRRALMLDVLLLQRRNTLREQRMTWREGMTGFVREFKKELRDEGR